MWKSQTPDKIFLFPNKIRIQAFPLKLSLEGNKQVLIRSTTWFAIDFLKNDIKWLSKDIRKSYTPDEIFLLPSKI